MVAEIREIISFNLFSQRALTLTRSPAGRTTPPRSALPWPRHCSRVPLCHGTSLWPTDCTSTPLPWENWRQEAGAVGGCRSFGPCTLQWARRASKPSRGITTWQTTWKGYCWKCKWKCSRQQGDIWRESWISNPVGKDSLGRQLIGSHGKSFPGCTQQAAQGGRSYRFSARKSWLLNWVQYWW